MKLFLIIKRRLKVLGLIVVLKRTLFRLVYYNPETGYCVIYELKRNTGLPKEEFEKFLHERDVYTRFKPVIRKFKRRRVFKPESINQFDADLLFIKKFIKYNNGINYLLVVIDAFSKYAWVYPIKRKIATEVLEGLKKVFKEQIPKCISTDERTEFNSKLTQKLFKYNNIHWFTTKNEEIKSTVVESFSRTIIENIMKCMHANNTERYIDVLPKLVKNYNNSCDRSIKMTPVGESRRANHSQVNKNLYK